MNHLVFHDARAGELEKILSGVKTKLVNEFDRAKWAAHPVCPDDSLYFPRYKDECALRVKASVVRVLSMGSNSNDDLSHTLKEMQPKLLLTEDQYIYWSVKKQILLVEFDCTHRIDMILVALNKITAGSDWIDFEDFSLIK